MELSSLHLCSQLKPSLTVQPYRQGHVSTLTYDSSHSFIEMSEPRCWMLFPQESQALLLEGKLRLWVTGEYWYVNTVVQPSQNSCWIQVTITTFSPRLERRCMCLLSECGDY